MSGYDFRGLGKRTRAAFREADDEANTRIRFAGGFFRGALRDVTNAARRREAAPTAARDVGLEASAASDAPKDGGDVGLEATAARDAPEDVHVHVWRSRSRSRSRVTFTCNVHV